MTGAIVRAMGADGGKRRRYLFFAANIAVYIVDSRVLRCYHPKHGLFKRKLLTNVEKEPIQKALNLQPYLANVLVFAHDDGVKCQEAPSARPRARVFFS